MQTAKCPHCGKDINVVTAGDLEKDYSISNNALQHAREKEQFPEPWLEFPNRNIWLRDAIESYAASRTQERVSKRVEELHKLLGSMSDEEREAVVTALGKTGAR